MMGTRQHRDLCTNAGCAGLVPECCRRLGKELFGDNAVRLSGPFILVFGDALSYQEALEYFELPLRISAYPLPSLVRTDWSLNMPRPKQECPLALQHGAPIMPP
jgi:hypothetical protein